MTQAKRRPQIRKNFVPPAKETVQENIVLSNNLTSEERAIYSRVASESDDWKTITEGDMEIFSLSEDPFKLPPPAQKLRDEKKFAFRWITRKPERLDQIKSRAVPFRWWPVNSTQPAPGKFDSYIDSNNGCVSREDQMLVFKPWWMFQRELDYKRQLADGNSADITAKDRTSTKTGDLEFAAGKRRGTDSRSLREEVKGSDIQYIGEAEIDRQSGIYTPEVSESDLVVNE